TRQRPLLTRPLSLESRDIALQHEDVGLRLADADIQVRDPAPPVCEAPVDRLELRHQSGLTLSGLGSLDSSLAEALLRLAKITRRVAEMGRPAAFLSGGGRRHDEHQGHKGGGDSEACHGRARRLASIPPMPPRTAPPAISTSI